MKTVFLYLSAVIVAAAGSSPLTFSNFPLGTSDDPLIFRTYMPDLDLDPAVFAHHGTGARSPRYNPSKGEDVAGEYKMIKGIPAAIGVNHGPSLSYCFDTIECRLMYTWQGGFLDMYNYWGDPKRGNRRSFGYVPTLVGTLFYKTEGRHPLHINGKSLSDFDVPPEFIGYRLSDNTPTFRYRVGEHTITLRVSPSEKPLTARCEFTCTPAATLSYRTGAASVTRLNSEPGRLGFLLTGQALGQYTGTRRNTNIKTANVEAGQTLYNNYGCIVCHSLDGSKSHGPTFAGLAGSQRPIEALDKPVGADTAYLLESMKLPNAKTVRGYPPNYMPTYDLKQVEYDSLVLFIQSLKQ